MSVCEHPNHDHYHAGEIAPMACADCGAPMHYDYGVEDYVHDAPEHPGCFLVQTRREGASECVGA